MKSLSRRDFLQNGVLGLVACMSWMLPLPGVRAQAQKKRPVVRPAHGTGLLVAYPNKLGPDLAGLQGMRVCAGGNAAQANSGYPDLLAKHGATIISVPLNERFEALQKGVCGALLFFSSQSSYDELVEQVRVFFPRTVVGPLEYRPFP
jgi:hypothetical protein